MIGIASSGTIEPEPGGSLKAARPNPSQRIHMVRPTIAAARKLFPLGLSDNVMLPTQRKFDPNPDGCYY